MAIIKCPECGKEVSTNTNQCVHCGSPFTVCPDCNTAVAGSPETCPICGCALKKTEAVPPEEKRELPKTETVLSEEEEKLKNSFMRVVNNGNHTEKSIKIAGRFLWVIDTIFLIVCAVIFWLWAGDLNSSDPSVLASRLLSYSKDCDMMRAFLSLACISGIVSAIYENVSKIALRGKYADMMRGLGVDKNQLMLLIQKMCHSDPSNDIDGIKIESYDWYSEINKRNMDTCYEIFFPEERKKSIIFAVVLSVLTALNGILIGIAVDKLFINDFFQSRMLGVTYELDYGWLIGVGVCLITYVVIAVIARRDGKRKEWIDKNLA